ANAPVADGPVAVSRSTAHRARDRVRAPRARRTRIVTIRDCARGRADEPRRRAASRDVGDPRPIDLARRAGTAPPTWRSARCLRYEDRRSRVRDAAPVRRAAAMTGVPRVFVGGDVERPLVAALGLDASFVAGIEPARLGPALVRILPTRTRAATRMMVVTGARGGVGRTLLATNV